MNRTNCGGCNQRQLLPVTDQVIYDHLAGKQTIGVYPLLSDDRCHFLAADLDGADWHEDAGAFMQSCRELGLPAALEISRSGNGAHAWIFFTEPVPAREARQLGATLISHTERPETPAADGRYPCRGVSRSVPAGERASEFTSPYLNVLIILPDYFDNGSTRALHFGLCTQTSPGLAVVGSSILWM